MNLNKLNGILNCRNTISNKFNCEHCDNIQYCDVLDNYDLSDLKFTEMVLELDKIIESGVLL